MLEGADSLIGRVINGESARELIGNVRILQGNVRIRCDRALQMIAAGTIELIGHVVVEDDSVTMTAPRGILLPGHAACRGLWRGAADRRHLDTGRCLR